MTNTYTKIIAKKAVENNLLVVIGTMFSTKLMTGMLFSDIMREKAKQAASKIVTVGGMLLNTWQ